MLVSIGGMEHTFNWMISGFNHKKRYAYHINTVIINLMGPIYQGSVLGPLGVWD